MQKQLVLSGKWEGIAAQLVLLRERYGCGTVYDVLNRALTRAPIVPERFCRICGVYGPVGEMYMDDAGFYCHGCAGVHHGE